MPAIELTNLTFRYPASARPVFHEVSLRVEEGECLAVLGPSGCGKSTLLRLISGLALPQSGTVSIGGAVVSGPGPGRAIVFQQGGGLFPWKTVRGNVVFALRKARPELSRAEACRRAEDALARVGLADELHRYPATLSGGMLQRAAIARALAMETGLLLLDEPFGALDPRNRKSLQQLLLELCQTEQKTVVLVTHDVDEAILLADRIAFFQPGGLKTILPVDADRPRRARTLLTSPIACKLRKELIQLFDSYGEAVEQSL